MSASSLSPGPESYEKDLQARLPFASVVWRLTGANALLTILAFVTSPILARSLGPAGRGELAAITTVLLLAPWISDLGLSAYLARERARSQPRGELLGSVIPIALAASLVGAAAAVPIGNLLGQGRETVERFVEITLLMLPLTVFVQTLYGLVLGEQRWRTIVLIRVLAAAIPALAIVGLALADTLTVESAAVAYIIATLVANVPLLVGLQGSRPWRFRRSVSKSALAFGLKSWVNTIAHTSNARLDQLLMAALVSSRQLGLYTLAVTISTVSSSLMTAVSNALFPRVAEGEAELAARATRVATTMVLVLNLLIGVTSPFLVPLVFGESFAGSVPMLAILLGASVVQVAGLVLCSTLTAAGDPASAARSQVIGLAITIPALLILLPSGGGIAAAWISLVAYFVSLTIALISAVRLFELPMHSFLFPKTSDMSWFRTFVRRGIRTR